MAELKPRPTEHRLRSTFAVGVNRFGRSTAQASKWTRWPRSRVSRRTAAELRYRNPLRGVGAGLRN